MRDSECESMGEKRERERARVKQVRVCVCIRIILYHKENIDTDVESFWFFSLFGDVIHFLITGTGPL